MNELHLLLEPGNIGYYGRCEITHVFLFDSKTNIPVNFFLIGVFDEQEFTGRNHQFLGKMMAAGKTYKLGIQRYYLSIVETIENCQLLEDEGVWDLDGNRSLALPELKRLAKQYVPPHAGNPVSKVLKNNFHSGSYILEYFDESKSTLDHLLTLASLPLFDKLCAHIRSHIPIDLSVIRDRAGNILIQLPVNILHANPKAVNDWTGVRINFSWHPRIKDRPECLIETEAVMDQNLMGAGLANYDKSDEQEVLIGNLDQRNHIHIWRKDPSLILYSFSGTYVRNFDFDLRMMGQDPRLFLLDGQLQKVLI